MEYDECKVFFALPEFCIEVIMQSVKKHILSLFVLALLSLATGVFAAVENVDCIDYNGNPDVRCKYFRIWDTRTAVLYVVPPESALVKRNAIPGASFYVFAPDEEKYSRDMLTLELSEDSTIVKNHKAVKGDADSGLVKLRVGSRYELKNFRLGTSDNADATDPLISLVYNFYVPYLKYIVEGKEVTDASKLQYEVGDTMLVDVEAIIPFGPAKGRVDSTLKRTFYFKAFGQSENLQFLSDGGVNLKQSDNTIRLNIDNGKGKFKVVATKAVTDGSNFSMNAFDDGKDSVGGTKFILTDPFPGEYQFTNPDMPTFDNAAIYDTDGDGIGDSIATWFGGQIESADVDTFYYSWPSDDDFKKYGGDVKRKENVFGLPDVNVELQTDSATGAVKAYVCSTVSGHCEWQQASLADSIGAAIQSATLVKGNGDTDTLIVRFNKNMDPSWTSGQGLKLNGDPLDVTAFSKKGDQWAFTVKAGKVAVGDMLKIETICDESRCPDGILTAADGVPTNKNNQEVPVKNAGRIYVDNDKNGFYDRDGDGRMDSTSLGFETPITEEDLKKMDITFYWLDNDGELVAIHPNLADLTISEDGTLLGFALDPEKYDVKNMLTGIDKSYSKGGDIEYGYASIANKISVDGKESKEEMLYGMNDYMAPVIPSTFLTPESFQMMEPDKFKITFSEAMDQKNVMLSDDCLAFYVDGAWVHYSLSSAEWSDDGRELVLYMEAGEDLVTRMNPADSVRFDNFTSGLADKKGNKVSELSPAVMVEGDPRVIMKTNSFADLNKAAELSDRVKPFTIEHVKEAKEASDQSSLGVLMDIGYATIMGKDEKGQAVPNMEDIGLHWELYVYTNIGNYVGGASGSIACDDPFFDGNCLENPDKLYVRWNMRSKDGRRVGAGVYLAKFRIKVYGAKDDFKVERIFRWGISAKRSK